jgi:hypothetical protein
MDPLHPGAIGAFQAEGLCGVRSRSRGIVKFKNVSLSGLTNNFGMHGLVSPIRG